MLKTFPALFTRVWFFPSVEEAMGVQMPQLLEAFPAVFANVGLRSRVNPLVGFQRPQVIETLPAVRAEVRFYPCVDPLVSSEVAQVAETFVTLGAVVRLQPGVGLQMGLEGAECVAGDAALRADELLLLRVALLVSGEVRQPGESPAAVRAAVRHLRVDQLVAFQLPGVDVTLVAFAAAVRSARVFGTFPGRWRQGGSDWLLFNVDQPQIVHTLRNTALGSLRTVLFRHVLRFLLGFDVDRFRIERVLLRVVLGGLHFDVDKAELARFLFEVDGVQKVLLSVGRFWLLFKTHGFRFGRFHFDADKFHFFPCRHTQIRRLLFSGLRVFVSLLNQQPLTGNINVAIIMQFTVKY